jgi:predicted PurR-regulated permease PerM
MFSRSKEQKPSQVVEITISNRTVVRVLAIVILSFMFLAALNKASHALLLIATGLFLALALNAPVQWVASHLPRHKKGNRTLATAISFLLVIVFLGAFLASIVPPLVSQTSNFITAAPRLVEDVRSDNNALGRFVRRYNLEPQVDKFAEQLSERTDNIAGSAFSTVSKIGTSIFSMLAILVIAFMMLIEGPRWLVYFKQFVPARRQAHAEELIAEMYGVVRGYVNGQVLLAALAASIMVVPLFALGISYPVALMVIVFIAGLVPMVGHTIGAAVVTTIALFSSVGSALAILAFYIVYQQIENYAVQPKIQANTTNMTPLMVFCAVIIGVSFGGLFGGLVAIPVAGCLRVLLVDYLESRKAAD